MMSGPDLGDGARRFHHDESDEDTGDASQKNRAAGDPERRARNIVYRLLTTRARSRAELIQSLLHKGIDEDTAVAVVQKFDDAGLIDDAAFAESWVEQRHRHHGLGRNELEQELRRKGVDESVITQAVSIVDDSAERHRARELVRRKLPTMTAPNGAVIRRLVAMLARKGYSEELAFEVVKGELRESGKDVESYHTELT